MQTDLPAQAKSTNPQHRYSYLKHICVSYLISSSCRLLFLSEFTYKCRIICLYLFFRVLPNILCSQYGIWCWQIVIATFRGLLLIWKYANKTSFSQGTGLKCIVHTTKFFPFTSVNIQVPVAFLQVLSKNDAISFCVLHHSRQPMLQHSLFTIHHSCFSSSRCLHGLTLLCGNVLKFVFISKMY
jgi:hypothetical protein